MDFFGDSFLDFARGHDPTEQDPRRTKEEDAQVNESLREVYPKVEKYYSIYSDTEDAWQADLTFFWERAKQYLKKQPGST